MKTAWSFTVLALLAMAAVFGLDAYAGAAGIPLRAVLLSSSIIEKLGEMGLVLLLLMVLVVGLIQLANAKAGARSGFLGAMTWVSAGLGAAVLLYAILMAQIVMETGPVVRLTHLQMGAIYVSHGMLAFALALGVAAVAAWLKMAIVAKGRRRKAVDAVA